MNILLFIGNSVRLWPVTIAPLNQASNGGPAHNERIVTIAFSRAFRQLISVSVDQLVRIWDIFSGQCVFEFTTTHTSQVTTGCLDSKGKRLLTGMIE